MDTFLPTWRFEETFDENRSVAAISLDDSGPASNPPVVTLSDGRVGTLRYFLEWPPDEEGRDLRIMAELDDGGLCTFATHRDVFVNAAPGFFARPAKEEAV